MIHRCGRGLLGFGLASCLLMSVHALASEGGTSHYVPVAFPMMMAFGGLLGLSGVALPAVELGIALSAVMLGALILGAIRLPLTAALLVLGFFAVFHGHVHGTEMTPGQSAILYSLGFVIATGLLHSLGIGIGLIHRWNAGRVALRGAGSVVMAGGLFFLWNALA